MTSASWFAEHALLPDGAARDVRFEVTDGRFTAITPNAEVAGARRLPGVVLPGLVNAHSHAFHRALRGRTHDGGGTFWTWRERMYAVADRLDPDSYLALARATYAEMALAGITTVAEFHYLHHGTDGTPYADPNAMAHALRQAAGDAGIRITLLDACYLTGGLEASGHRPLTGTQLRFGDRDADLWASRFAELVPSEGMRVGAAVHSVRAVPRDQIPRVVAAAAGAPLHFHLSEQVAENEACLAFYGCTPTELLSESGALGDSSTAVHATHINFRDVTALARSGTAVCFCPTTERDLGDGIGPARALAEAGAPLALGSDQHAVIDLIEEARALEMHERLASQQRGRMVPSQLLAAATNAAAAGWPDAGALAVGTRGDLVAIRTDSVRTAGCAPDQLLLAATAADVDTVVVEGRVVVENATHRLGDVGALLRAAVTPLWSAG